MHFIRFWQLDLYAGYFAKIIEGTARQSIIGGLTAAKLKGSCYKLLRDSRVEAEHAYETRQQST